MRWCEIRSSGVIAAWARRGDVRSFRSRGLRRARPPGDEMIAGKRGALRPLVYADLEVITGWGRDPEALFGPYQRFQMDYLQRLLDSYRQDGLLSRDAGVLM